MSDESRLAEHVRRFLSSGSEDPVCSYSQGYLKRQAVFACLTCNPLDSTSDPGGVCLVCARTCHEGHRVLALDSKRNFRCDCGNSLFPGNACQLEPQKEERNGDNVYNHNFQGRLCSCDKFDPEPDVDAPELRQCGVCEDWFHKDHVMTEAPSGEDNYEFVCEQCVKKHDFLRALKVEVGDVEGRGTKRTIDNDKKPSGSSVAQGGSCNLKGSESGVQQKGSCKFKAPGPGVPQALFLSEGWRKELCRCKECLERYKQQQVEFLLDPEDNVKAYIQREMEKATEDTKQAMYGLASLDRNTQLEILMSIEGLRPALALSMLLLGPDEKIVTEANVDELLEEMARARDENTEQEKSGDGEGDEEEGEKKKRRLD